MLPAFNVNTSFDQTIPFDDMRASRLHQAIISIFDQPEVYTIICVGSVKFMSGPSTAINLKKHLDNCLEEALFMGKTKLIVFNGANYSGNDEGTTYTSSNWIQNTYNKYRGHPKYKHISFYCIGLAPHSTDDMKAVWMEELGNTRTQTYINALQAKDRQELLAIYGTYANKVIINEGAKGTLHEVYNMYKINSGMFSLPNNVIVNNSKYLVDKVIPDILNNKNMYDEIWLEQLQNTLKDSMI